MQVLTDAQDQPILFRMLVVYVTTVYSDVDPALLSRVVRTVKPEWEDEMLSIAARQWMAEGAAKGEAKGRAEGKAEGKADMLLRQLRRRFSVLDSAVEARVRAADSDRLDQWSERILDARTLSEVFDAPPH